MTVATLGYTMVICGNSNDPQHRYRGRIEKVKFGVPIEEAFVHDIPATLLVLLLKVHKDGPAKKDIWRAPGNQAQVRKLSHIMQHGRLVNIANFSVYTAASVIKKFLSKLPGGIFGLENEQKLFDLYNVSSDLEMQRQSFCRVLGSLPIPSQHLLVLLFGTFYMISESADSFGSRMTTEALGISVAPSLFHSCIHDGQRAKIEDVIRFKIASEIISRIIENFGYANLFPQESYEFYARITGRTLRLDENDSRLRFVTPANVHDWPVPPPSTYSIMAARCAGSYSMSTIAAVDHVSSNCGRHSDHQQQYLQNMIENVSIWATNRIDCMGNRGETRKIDSNGDVKTLHCPVEKHCLSLDTTVDSNELEPSLLTSTTSLQPQQRTSGYPYKLTPDCKRTFFGTGPQHITVATIADDELISKNEKLVLRPSNSQITTAFANEHQSLSNHLRNTQVSTVLVLPGSYSQPDVVIVNADATDGGGAGDRNYRRYSRRQAQSANNYGLVYKRLSSSAAEVQLSHRDDEKYSLNAFHSSEILESTHSLTYLEWVHERQTRRMRTRSEWFLLPAPSAKDSGTSQLNTSVLSSTSMLQPCSQFDDSIMGSFDGCMGNPDNIDECLVNVTQKLPLPKTYEGAISPSLADISGQLPPAPQPVTSPTSRMAGGIVRRRSWRTHYVRPDRIVKGDNKERGSSEVAIISSRSTPLYRRNVPHTSSRSLPSASRPIMLPSSLMEFQQQRQRSRSTSPEYEKGYVNTGSGSSTSHVKGSKAILQSKLVHF